MSTDWNKIRNDFPILATKRDNKSLVYLDNSATSQKPNVVIDTISNYYKNSNANIHRGLYTLSEEATMKYKQSKETVAKFINAATYKEIVYTKNATESLNTACLMLEGKLNEGDEILITMMEHHSNLIPWQKLAQRKKCILKYAKIDAKGDLDIADFYNNFTDKTKIVAITHVSNVLGTINDVKEITMQSKKLGAYVVIDGAQAVGHIRVDVADIGCDFYAFSSHKMLGSTGLGVLYAKEDLLNKFDPIFYGGEMVSHTEMYDIQYNELPWKFEAGTPNIEGAFAINSAIEYINEIGIENIENRCTELLDSLNRKIKIIPGIKIYGESNKKISIVSFTIDGVHAHDIASILDKDNICIRSGNHCAEVLVNSLGQSAVSRASLHFYNNEEDIDKFITSLSNIQKFFNHE